MYVQMAFALDRVKALAPLHPEWKDTQPFKAALERDMKTLTESGEHEMTVLVTAGTLNFSVGQNPRHACHDGVAGSPDFYNFAQSTT